MKKNIKVWGLAALLGVGGARAVQANERKFSYTYESGVLPAGTRELEFWSTWRAGRANFFSQFDYRTEFEWGVTDRLLSAFYLNWHSATSADPANPGQKVDENKFDGLSSEWKYKLMDPVADPVGLALYQEYTFKSDELEWESKLILDKKVGKLLMAYNGVVEPDWEFSPGNGRYSLNLENDLAVAYFFTPAFSAGAEAVNVNEKTRSSTGLQSSALYLGPVLSYAREGWWVTLTVLRQLPALKRSLDHPEDLLVLDNQEKFNLRLLFSIRI